MAYDVRTPVIVFGLRQVDDTHVDDLHIAATLEHAVEHAQSHGGLDDFEFFDFDGQPFTPIPGSPVKVARLDQRRSLENRVRSFITRVSDELDHQEKQEIPEELVTLLRGFVAGQASFHSLATSMAERRPSHGPASHSRGGFHNLCHRLHLC
jgi:hypothetical protein